MFLYKDVSSARIVLFNSVVSQYSSHGFSQLLCEFFSTNGCNKLSHSSTYSRLWMLQNLFLALYKKKNFFLSCWIWDYNRMSEIHILLSPGHSLYISVWKWPTINILRMSDSDASRMFLGWAISFHRTIPRMSMVHPPRFRRVSHGHRNDRQQMYNGCSMDICWFDGTLWF